MPPIGSSRPTPVMNWMRLVVGTVASAGVVPTRGLPTVLVLSPGASASGRPSRRSTGPAGRAPLSRTAAAVTGDPARRSLTGSRPP